GRLTVTWICSCWLAGISCSGRILPCVIFTATGRLWGPVTTLMLSMLPPPSGMPILAMATSSAVRLAFAEVSVMPATTTPATATSMRPARTYRMGRRPRGAVPTPARLLLSALCVPGARRYETIATALHGNGHGCVIKQQVASEAFLQAGFQFLRMIRRLCAGSCGEPAVRTSACPARRGSKRDRALGGAGHQLRVLAQRDARERALVGHVHRGARGQFLV